MHMEHRFSMSMHLGRSLEVARLLYLEPTKLTNSFGAERASVLVGYKPRLAEDDSLSPGVV